MCSVVEAVTPQGPEGPRLDEITHHTRRLVSFGQAVCNQDAISLFVVFVVSFVHSGFWVWGARFSSGFRLGLGTLALAQPQQNVLDHEPSRALSTMACRMRAFVYSFEPLRSEASPPTGYAVGADRMPITMLLVEATLFQA